MSENLVKKIDKFSGVAFDILEWDFLSMTVDIFKKRFKEYIEKPLRLLLDEFNRNPRVVMQALLHASIRGLVSGLANYYKVMLSTSAQQRMMSVGDHYGPSTSRPVCFICFQSISKIRRTCLTIIDKDRTATFVLSRKSFDEIEELFADPAYAPLLSTLRQAQPGLTFPLLVCWRITELMPTDCPDTIFQPRIVNYISEAGLSDIPPSISNEPKIDDVQSKNKAYINARLDDKNFLFGSALMAKPDLYRYINETCAICESSGIKKLLKCSRCGVARYCGREHQVEHWSIHRKHCERLRFFAILKSDAELCPYLGKVCALCKDPDGGDDDKILEQCTRCNVAYYCGKDHQVEHWSVHKKHCKRLCDLKK